MAEYDMGNCVIVKSLRLMCELEHPRVGTCDIIDLRWSISIHCIVMTALMSLCVMNCGSCIVKP